MLGRLGPSHDSIKKYGFLRLLLKIILTPAFSALTDADPDVGAGEVAVGLRHRSHPNLVERARQESGEGAHERDGALPSGTPNANADEVLLRNEALDEAIGESIAELDAAKGEQCSGEVSPSPAYWLLDLNNINGFFIRIQLGFNIPQVKV